jgi:hypothetical protein
MRGQFLQLFAITTLCACSSGEIPIGRIIRELVSQNDGGPTGNGQTCSWQGTSFGTSSDTGDVASVTYDLGDEFASPDGCNECSCTRRGILCTTDTCEPTECTADARLCPDGSAVGREGPDCEFAPCPGEGDGCQEDGKICADGTVIVREGPDCEFAPCPDEIACTLEAKLCPDGSAVGREGPDCEFAPCPGEIACTREAKLCPDGSAVGREGPDCEFAPCP